MKWLILILPLYFLLLSCNYKIVKHVAFNGSVIKERDYNSDKRQERYIDKNIFKFGRYELVPRTQRISMINDFTLKSDSLTFVFDTGVQYKQLFSYGVIPGRLIDSITGTIWTNERTNLETGEIVPATKEYRFFIYSIKLLKFRYRVGIARFKIYSNPNTYFVEVRSSSRVRSIDKFLQNANVVFIRSCCPKI